MHLFSSKDEREWIKKCSEILLTPENENPFPKPPIATNFYNNPPSFCYGRDKYIEEIKYEIRDSIHHKQPKLIRVIGKQGIGKSTLICWTVNQISETYQIPVTYLETSSQPEDYEMRALYRQFVSNLERSGICVDILLNSIRKFINLLVEEGGNLYEELSKKFAGDEINSLSVNLSFIRERIDNPSFYNKLIDLLTGNIIILKQLIPVDLNFLMIFWKSHIQNPNTFDAIRAFQGNYDYSGYNVETNNDASKYIDELIELIRWCFDEKTTIILIFDHLEAGISEHQEDVYKNLFSLLLNLRQKKFLTIILSGTLDAFGAFDEILQEDQELQLNNWSKIIALTNLEPNYIIDIVNKYLFDFWSKCNYQPSPDNSLFPFGINSIKYLYENNGLDLRKTLKNLYELIEYYKKNKKLEHINTFFKAFKAFRQREDIILTITEQREFTKKLLDPSIQDKVRSTKAELALCDFFGVLKNHSDYDYLTDVKHEPPLGKSGKKPDVFLEFFGNLGAEFVKNLGIEVKVYRKSNKVTKMDIEKTYKLLEENALDYVTWITNVELDLKYRFAISEGLKEYIGRVSPLGDIELGYLSFMTYFKEIFERNPTIEEVEGLLNKLNLSPLTFKKRLSVLSKLTKEIKIPKEEKEITEFAYPQGEPISTKSQTFDDTQELIPKKREPLEVGVEKIKQAVKNYIIDKSKTNKQITYHYTTKAIREELNLEESKELDDDIWTIALDIGNNYSVNQTTKTIYFQ